MPMDVHKNLDVNYAYTEAIDFGKPTEVAPDIFWVRMPLDLTGLNHINLWLLRDGEGWTIIDTGMRSDKIENLWESVFRDFLEGQPVTRVICTHFHPDHIGQAGWLTRKWDCPLWMTHREWLQGRVAEFDQHDIVPDWHIAYFRKAGLSKTALATMAESSYRHFSSAITPLPPQVHSVQETEDIVIGGRKWQIIIGRGHSPEHMCLFNSDAKVLISGDQILPKITPHIGVHASDPDANPLQLYLDTLANFDHLPEDTFVLPSHGLPFYRLHPRLEFLRAHHEHRLSVLEDFCREPTKVLSTLKVMFSRRLNEYEALLGMSEAVSHLHYLMGKGRIIREADENGVWNYWSTG